MTAPTPPYTREVLDAALAADPTDSLTLHSSCHRDAPTWATYRDGQLRLTCAACATEIAVIVVARAEAGDRS